MRELTERNEKILVFADNRIEKNGMNFFLPIKETLKF
jgi:hypothetical protein